MTILAVYDHQQLQLPGKVLTHREDIDPLLQELGVRLDCLDLPTIAAEETDQAIIAACTASLADIPSTTGLSCMRVQRVEAAPGYADEPTTADEQQFPQPVALLLVRGAGVVCLHQEQQLLVLSCRRGDLLTLPAYLPHWFVPSAGQPSLLVMAAANEQALNAEKTSDDISARYQMLEL